MQIIKKLASFTIVFLLLLVVNLYSQNSVIEVAPAKIMHTIADTVPSKIELDLNKLEVELKSIWNNAEESFKKIDWSNLQKQINKSIEKIDLDASLKKAQIVINNLDIKKIAKELKENEKLDWKIMESDLQNALKDINKIDVKKLQTEINKLKLKISETQKQKLKNNIKELQPILQQKLNELQKEIENLKINLNTDKTDHYTIIQNNNNNPIFEAFLNASI